MDIHYKKTIAGVDQFRKYTHNNATLFCCWLKTLSEETCALSALLSHAYVLLLRQQKASGPLSSTHSMLAAVCENTAHTYSCPLSLRIRSPAVCVFSTWIDFKA